MLKDYIPQELDTSADEHLLPMPEKQIVMHQYSNPACVGFACAMAKMLREYAITNKWVELSPYSIYGYYANNGDGMGIKYGAEALKQWGALPKKDFTETGDNPELHKALAEYRKNNAGADKVAAKYKIDGYTEVHGYGEITQALAANMPVVISVIVDKSFGRRAGGIEPIYPNNAKGYHAVCICGWKKIGGNNYLVAINSYGDGRFVYIPEQRAIFEAVAIADKFTSIKRKAKEINFVLGADCYISDGEVKQMDVKPYIKNARTYLPIRFASEELGASVEWHNGTIILRSEEAEIFLQIGSKQINVNGYTEQMDVVPEIRNGRTMCPIRFIAEALNCTVLWDDITNEITIKSL